MTTVLCAELTGEDPGEPGGARRAWAREELLRAVASRHQGVLAEHHDAAVVAVFMAPADALSAAVTMQQEIAAYNRLGSLPLSVRIGVCAGTVSWEGAACIGAPVVCAEELCAKAAPGHILLAAPDTAQRNDAAGPNDAGQATDRQGDQHSSLAVAWEPAAEPSDRLAVPLPALLLDSDAFPFVGRELERQVLDEAWKSAAAGEPRIVLVGGEPGVGKSRLVGELAASAYADGAIVLAGRCDDRLRVPYQPFAEALRYLVAHAGREQVTALLGRRTDQLAQLVPTLVARRPEGTPTRAGESDSGQLLLWGAVAQAFAATSARAPVLLVLEDLHAAGVPTLQLMRHVLGYAGPLRLLVVGTYRDVALDLTHPLGETLTQLRHEPIARRITLDNLDAAGVTQLLTAAMGHDLDHRARQLAQDIHVETDGNPLFVGEVLRHLAETGAITLRGRRWSVARMLADSAIPRGLARLIGRRLSLLPAAAGDTLVRAGVIGLDFDVAVLAATCDLDADALATALAEAVAARLIALLPDGHYRISHSVIQTALYELATLRRVRLHRRAGQAIEACFPDRQDEHLPELAYHFARAGASETTRALEYSQRAGDQALSLSAYADAVSHYQRALELVGDDPIRRCDLLTGLGLAERAGGDPAYRITLRTARKLAVAAQDGERAARAVLATTRTLWSPTGGSDAELGAAYTAALELVGEEDSAVRARLLAALADEHVGDTERVKRLHLADDAVAIARRRGDRELLADVLAKRWSASYDLSSVSERSRAAAELLRLAGEDPVRRSAAQRCRLLCAIEIGDGDEADRQVIAGHRLAAAVGAAMPRWRALVAEVTGALLHAQLPDAEDLIGQALTAGQQANHPDAAWWHARELFHLRFEQGRLAELLDQLGEQVKQAPDQPVRHAELALAYCEVGRYDDARGIVDELSADRFVLPLHADWGLSIGVLSEVCSQLAEARRGDTQHADGLYRALAPYAGVMVTDGVAAFGATDYHLGVLATLRRRYDVAEERFAAAAPLYDRLRAPGWQARLDVAHASMLRARGRRRDGAVAGVLLERALATATPLGLAGVVRRVAQLRG